MRARGGQGHACFVHLIGHCVPCTFFPCDLQKGKLAKDSPDETYKLNNASSTDSDLKLDVTDASADMSAEEQRTFDTAAAMMLKQRNDAKKAGTATTACGMRVAPPISKAV